MFRNAIVRIPCRGIKDGLTTSSLGKPDYKKSLSQHSEYIHKLKQLGLNVNILAQNEKFPDSTFIEDVAICTQECAVITNPGAESRRDEITGMRQVLENHYDQIEEIKSPGTLEGGDVMMVETHCFIGISDRTNIQGAEQLIKILGKYGMTGSIVMLNKMLHLKSGVSYLENNKMLVCGEFIGNKIFGKFDRILIEDNESYAANSLWINDRVLVPDGFPETRKKIEKAGYETIVLDMSEFRKIDGGLSCLSLRF
jgi:dimethylargininase